LRTHPLLVFLVGNWEVARDTPLVLFASLTVYYLYRPDVHQAFGKM